MIALLSVIAGLVLFILASSARASARTVAVTPRGKQPGKYDALIANVAKEYGIDPVLLKAIVAKESNFDPFAVNPEKSGVNAKKLRDSILAGKEPRDVGVPNPSLGLAQVRIGIGRKMLGQQLKAKELFDPATNLMASAKLLRELFAAGITLDTIDAYNVGQGLRIRNLRYRDDVNAFYQQFKDDF